jgi:hypothetical protein
MAKTLKICKEKVLLDCFLKAHNIYIFLAQVFLELATSALYPEPPDIPNECFDTHWITLMGVIPLRGIDRALLEVEGLDVALGGLPRIPLIWGVARVASSAPSNGDLPSLDPGVDCPDPAGIEGSACSRCA